MKKLKFLLIVLVASLLGFAAGYVMTTLEFLLILLAFVIIGLIAALERNLNDKN